MGLLFNSSQAQQDAARARLDKLKAAVVADASLAGALGVMLFLWAIVSIRLPGPLRGCSNHMRSKRYIYFPLVTIVNITGFFTFMLYSKEWQINDIFFLLVAMLEVLVDNMEHALESVATVLFVLVAWKMRWRILKGLGLQHIGSLRDWLTCWSMARYKGAQLYLWKVEGLVQPTSTTRRTLFLSIEIGVNSAQRSRVHSNVHTSVVLRETCQFNIDDTADDVLTIRVMEQNVIGAQEICHTIISAGVMKTLRAQAQLIGVRRQPNMSMLPEFWTDTNFHGLHMVPRGFLFLRLECPDDAAEGTGLCSSCCFPSADDA